MSHSLLVGRGVNFKGFSAKKYSIFIEKKGILYLMSLCGEYLIPISQQQEMDERNKNKAKIIHYSSERSELF